MSTDHDNSMPYSMPHSAPLYAPPPYVYQDSHSINILFRTKPEILHKLVPAPLKPNPDSLILIYASSFHIVSPQKLDYLEAGIGSLVTFRNTPGTFFHYLYLNHALGIVPGREIYGFPKKDAVIHFKQEDEVVSCQVIRDGISIIDMAVRRVTRVDPIPEEPVSLMINFKIIPSVKRDTRPEVMQLTTTDFQSDIKELYTGIATLKFASTMNDPLGDLPIVDVLGGRYTVEDSRLGFGDILYDYLA